MSRTAVLLVQEDGGETQAQSVEYVGQPLQWYKLVKGGDQGVRCECETRLEV